MALSTQIDRRRDHSLAHQAHSPTMFWGARGAIPPGGSEIVRIVPLSGIFEPRVAYDLDKTG